MTDYGLPSNEPSLAVRGGQLVSSITWFLLVVSSLAIVARVFAKHVVARKLGTDDAFAVIALVSNSPSNVQSSQETNLIAQIFSIGSAGATSAQVANGLGQHLQDVEGPSIDAFFKVTHPPSALSNSV